jgi:hypothetical protein
MAGLFMGLIWLLFAELLMMVFMVTGIQRGKSKQGPKQRGSKNYQIIHSKGDNYQSQTWL